MNSLLNAGKELDRENLTNTKIIDTVISRLVAAGYFEKAAEHLDFSKAERAVSECFEVSESSITTRMARLLIQIAASLKPKNILVIGSYLGNSLVWLSIGAGSECQCVGVDVDEVANDACRRNFQRLAAPNVEILQMDGHLAHTIANTDYDLVLLDADDPIFGKKIYSSLAISIFPRLRPGGILIAHDISWPKFQNDFMEFRELMADKSLFQQSLILPIDQFGLAICMKTQ